MWPVYAAEIQASFADVLGDDEAAAVRDALLRVHDAARQPATIKVDPAVDRG
jgi:hypothetical protein